MRHFAANYIFDGSKLIKNAYISVDNYEKIIFVSAENQALREKPFMKFYNGILCPGLINSHCHLELSTLNYENNKNIGLSAFIKKMIAERANYNEPKKIKIADDIMFLKGVNLCADISNTNASIETKLNSKIKYVNFIEQSGLDENLAQSYFDKASEICNEFISNNLEAYIVPHSFYSVSEKLLNKISSASKNSIISIHFLESSQEKELFENQTGKLYDFLKSFNGKIEFNSGLQGIYDKIENFSEAKSIILVHNVKTQNKNLKNSSNLYFCLCPNSNLLLHNELADENFVYSNKDKIILGTDSLASNNSLDILAEIKTMSENYNNLDLIDLLKMATSNASKALVNTDYGNFTINSKPGIVLIQNLDLVNMKINENTNLQRII